MANLLTVLTWLFLAEYTACAEEGPAFVLESPSRIYFLNSKGVVLQCAARGQAPISVGWLTMNGSPVSPVAGVRVLNGDQNATLQLLAFKPEKYHQDIHATTYRCLAENSVGSIISRPSVVQAVVTQQFDVSVSNTTGEEGGYTVLKCDVQPTNLDQVRIEEWRMDGRVFKPSLKPERRFWVLPSGEFVVKNLKSSDAYSEISCSVYHKLEKTRKSSNLAKILITGFRMLSPPQLLVKQEEIYGWSGQNLLLPCLAKGYPAPTLTWFKNDEMSGQLHLEKTSNFFSKERLKVIEDQLIFEPLRTVDAGIYVCIANNSEGNDSYRVSVSVRSYLKVEVDPSVQRVNLNQSALLTCHVKGQPVTSVSWYKDGKQLSDFPRVSADGKVLRISQLTREDAGMYQCFARNEFDAAQDTAQINLGDSPPQIDYDFISQILHPGASVSFKCIATGVPSPLMRWTLDGFSMPQSDRFVVGQHATETGAILSHVNITSVHSVDGGSYTCIAANRAGTQSHTARLNVYGPVFVRSMSIVTAVADEDFYLTCPATGYPLATISWEKDGRLLPLISRQAVYDNGTLFIRKLQKSSDGGKYICIARDAQGRTHSSIATLQVLVPPVITPFSFGFTNAGERIQMVCSLQKGDPPLSIFWLKDDESLVPSDGVHVRSIDQYSKALLLESVEEKHSGNYTCVATNSVRTAMHSSSLIVNVPPTWIQVPTDRSVVSGSSLRIPCQATGFPEPIVTWRKAIAFKPKQFAQISSRHSRVSGAKITSSGDLAFEEVLKEDEGQYLCEASNGVGIGISVLITINVQAPPKFDTSFKKDVSVRRGAHVSLQCLVRGDSPLKLMWKKDQMQLPQKLSVSKETTEGLWGKYLIYSTAVEDSGKYKCLSENDYGNDTFVIKLKVEDIPPPPYGLRVEENKARKISISWLPHSQIDSSSVDKYIVQYRQIEGMTWSSAFEEEITARYQPNVILRNLDPATSYVVRVIAKNQVGSSAPSEALQVRTKGEPPSNSPRAVTVKPLNSTTIEVNWKSPFHNTYARNILGFSIGIKRQRPRNNDNYKFTEANPLSRRAIVGSLQPWTYYSVVTRAYNAHGPGPSSLAIRVRTPQDVPSKPPTEVTCIDNTSSTSMKIRWKPPPKISLNGVLQGYRVVLTKLCDDEGAVTETSRNSTSTEEIITGLIPWSNYSVTVAAFTEAGLGVSTQEILCRTKEDIPGAPALRAFQSTKDSVLLTWLPPEPPSGLLLGFTLYHRGPNDHTPIKYSFKPNEESITLNRLTRGSHLFWLSARNKAGEGMSSLMIRVTLTDKVRAAIASWGKKVAVQRGEDVRFECVTVGPFPFPPFWTTTRIYGEKKLRIDEDGAILLRKVEETDAGNYSCSVNSFDTYGLEFVDGYTSATYSLLVKANPRAPYMQVENRTPSSILLKWSPGYSGGVPVCSWNLSWRLLAGNGNWQTKELGGSHFKHTIKKLRCGSEYQVYITAKTRVGVSPPSSPLVISATGGPPVPPPAGQAATANATHVRVWLDRWADGGCTITHFMLESREAGDRGWITVTSNLGPQDSYDLRHQGRSRIRLRLTAHNGAGATSTIIKVPSPSSFGVTTEGGKETNPTLLFLRDPRMVAYFAASLVALTLTSIPLVIFIRKKATNAQITSGKKIPRSEKKEKNKIDLRDQPGFYADIHKKHARASDQIPDWKW